MTIIIGADTAGQSLKNTIKAHLLSQGEEILDVTEQESVDFVEATRRVVQGIQQHKDNLGVVIDAYGSGSFMVATKIKGIIAAQVSDERSAYMTRGHNNSRLITLGCEIVGNELVKNIVDNFIHGSYDGGRHQIRVDMLNKMC